MILLKLAAKSLANRRGTVLLTIFSIAISVALLIGVERVRTETKERFASTISGTDLIIGARTGSMQLLLYSVFRMGDASNNISWDSYQKLLQQKSIAWAVPLSLGDSHRGYRVLGTTSAYFQHYQYGKAHTLKFQAGQAFDGVYEAVIGAEVAKKLNYRLGDEIVLAHGAGSTSFMKHDNLPFTVVGILAPTATPVDQTVHVSLAGIEAIHVGWEKGAPSLAARKWRAADISADRLQPKMITAALVGLTSKVQVFRLQRFVNEFQDEPLMAIIPGVALHELWRMVGVAERSLIVISGCVVSAGLLGMLTMLLAGLGERRREMAILRAVGARPLHVFLLLISESALITLAGVLTGLGLLGALQWVGYPVLLDQYGIDLTWQFIAGSELKLLAAILLGGILMGGIPSVRAYRNSLSDGMSIRV